MGLDECSDESFEGELSALKKRMHRNKVLGGLAGAVVALGLLAGHAIMYREAANEMWDIAVEESINRPSAAEIEGIARGVDTPEDAFSKINADIAFVSDFDKIRLGRHYWLSLQETYGERRGDCAGGAIAFAAMLSDDPKYSVKLVCLRRPQADRRPNHMIAAYESNGLWGAVSFNNKTASGEEQEIFIPASFTDIGSVIEYFDTEYAGSIFESYFTVGFDEEELKFGRGLHDSEQDRSPPIMFGQDGD
ncbi:MAG TPA: hypothetical protein HA362_01780 [Nanoarchaeota archaeon]|nr:hypothetical protein [Nanoarchaeota archaeon]